MDKIQTPIYVTQPILPDKKKLAKRLNKIWDARWLTNFGPQSQTLEEKLKTYLKVPHISLFNNGTNALTTALKALDLGEGEIITTPFTFAATPHSITMAGLTPVFCDINGSDLTIDVKKIEMLITNRTKAIMAVHVFGLPCDVFKIQKIAKKHNLKVIYDAAHAFGTEIDGRGLGTFGDITMFSFHATKLFHTAEGGALTTNSKEIIKQIRLWQNFGIANEEEVVLPGVNGKINEIQAAIGLTVLEQIHDERSRRKNVREFYERFLSNTPGIEIVSHHLNNVTQESYQYFAIRAKTAGEKSRNGLHDFLKDHNVFARKYFYPLCSNFAHYKDFKSAQKDNLPVANKVVSEVLALPYYGDLTEKEVKKICKLINTYYG
jgi:dTDP-4-amino-4,6-dideoxygalactose transaminase